MAPSRSAIIRTAAAAAAVLATGRVARSAPGKLADLIAAAKSEKGGFPFVSAATTLGGQPGVNALNAAFEKRFGFSPNLTLTPGPNMVAMAARVMTEFRGNHTSSTAMYMGTMSTLLDIDKIGGLLHVDWPGTFPWITREMVNLPNGASLLVRTGINLIEYNPKLIPPGKAPRRYQDLVDPKMDPVWQGKLAMPPYVDWLVDLCDIWSQDQVLDFASKLSKVAAGQLRYGEAESLINGQFAMIANDASALESKWLWQDQGVTLGVVPGSDPLICDYLSMSVPKNSPAPNLATLFVGWLVSPEAQQITDKFGGQASHLVRGTRVYQFVRDNHLRLWPQERAYTWYQRPQLPQIYAALGKVIPS